LSGQHITQQQRAIYMGNRQSGNTQALSSAKAGLSTRTGRRIEKQPFTTQPKQRNWRTREDPISVIWEKELLPLLHAEPSLSGLTLWEYLDDNYPGSYPPSLLRTLQRRVKFFKATHGADKPVIFRQNVPIGHQGLSDFTHPDTDITLAGKPFPHLIYQFRLAYSGWRYAHIIKGGESYSALAEGLQNALIKLGGSPVEHRTDSLSAAYNNHYQAQQLTKNYQALCQHYGITATRNTKGVSHENGAIETAHRSLKHRIRQAVALRGHNDFASITDYQQLLDNCTKRLNAYTRTKLTEEKIQLQPLPKTRFMDYMVMTVKVTTASTIEIKRITYSVPSRLIGETIAIHLYHDKLCGFMAQTSVFDLPRCYPEHAGMRARRIDYRHVINALAAKPQAFRFSVFRDELFPDDNYKAIWQHIDQQLDSKPACKWMVSVLKIAASHQDVAQFGEDVLAQMINGKTPELKQLQSQFLPKKAAPTITVKQHDLRNYDQFIPSHAGSALCCH
jgi:hypothetical protein